MATPAWQPLPMQPPAPGQPPNTVPQNRWGSPGTAVNQGQVLPPRPMYAPPSGYPMGSPSTVMPSYGGSHQLNTSGTSAQSPSHQPQLSPAVSSGLLQAGIAAAPLSHVGHGGPPLPGYNMPSTPPPGNAMPGPPTPPVHLGQSILTAVNSGQGVFSPPGHAPPGVPPPSPGHVGSASSSVHSVHTALPPGVGSCSAPPSHTGNNASLPGQPGYITPGQALPGAFLPGPPPGAPPPGHSGAPAPPNIATTAPPHAPLGLPPPGHSAPSAPPVHVATTSTSSSNTVPSSPLAAGQAVSNSVLPPGQATSPVPPSPSHTGSSVPPPPGHPGSLGPPSGAGYGPFQASFSGMWQSTNMGPPGFGPPGSTPPPIPLGARPPVDASLLGARPGVPLTNSSSNQGMMPMPSPAVVQQPVYQPYHSGPALGPPQPLGPWMGPPQVPPQQPPPYALYHNPYVSPYSSQPPPVGPPDGIYISGPQASHVPQFKPPGVPGEAASQATSGQPLGMWGHSTPVPGTPLHTSTKDGGEPVDNNSSGAESASPPVPGVPGLSEKDDSATGTGEKLEVTGKEGAEVGDSWTAHKTLDGTLYYYNAVTGQSTYDKPAGFKGEPEKVTAQPTPVSWERINGTDWALVITNDGKKYYYNTVTQVTSWQVPSEVTEFRKKKVSEEVVSKQGPDNTPGATVADKGTVSFTLNMPAVSSGSRESIGYKGIVPTGATALDLIKKKLQDFGSPVTTNTTSTGPSPSGVTNGSSAGDSNNGKVIVPEENRETPKGTVDASSSDTSSESDDEVPEPSKEERVLQFKDMLKEKGVAPFSKWEKELPKIIFDPRFKAIPSHTERRSIFEHYVRTRADEERKEKRAAQKAAIEGFKQLLEESIKDISHSTDYEGFAKLWSHDSRFEALDRKDREALLNERVIAYQGEPCPNLRFIEGFFSTESCLCVELRKSG
ncbi:hypothetical protein O6H91_01G039500 [Diphasiastrum complanatum]|uniref:Uncharacterized protein n=1 Tax=Diphasiastrum complanatum TaxID=34168 RepID=A0ACC2EQ12_DIPCM|nr:hypothetical protein O6H91_01G039500 [Diphasiastrum complanatum]